MKDRPTFLSVFSGIGGFDLGLARAGWECVGQIELDAFCTRVLARHWPDTPRWGDVRTIAVPRELDGAALRDGDGGAPAVGGQHELPVPGAVDLLCGGFPCQDLSVAGRRAGLAAPRSGLFFEFVRLARELRPRWLLLENVPGLLSSNGGRDFAVVLAALGDAGYGVGWRVLDARWFGVPQRRRRVFLVGRLGGPCPLEVLFEPQGVRGDPAAGGEAGAGLAGTLGGGAGKRGWCSDVERMTFVPTAYTTKLHNTHSNQAGKLYEDYSPSLQEHSPAPAALYYSHDYNQDRVYDPEGIAPAVTAQDSTGARQFLTGAAVRRLTPTECEKLQAFPPGWTCLCGVEPYTTADCRCPDGPRYAACGNAVTASVVEWLGRRIMSVYGT